MYASVRSVAASPCVVTGGVSAPGAAGFGDQPGGGLVVIAECLREDGGRGLEDELSDWGGPAALRRNADLTQRDLQADRVQLTGFIGCPGWRPGKSHCEFRTAAPSCTECPAETSCSCPRPGRAGRRPLWAAAVGRPGPPQAPGVDLATFEGVVLRAVPTAVLGQQHQVHRRRHRPVGRVHVSGITVRVIVFGTQFEADKKGTMLRRFSRRISSRNNSGPESAV